MPRRKPKGETQTLESPILMLPPGKPRHRHPHEDDPYESLPGGVPRVEVTGHEPITRKLSRAEEQQRSVALSEQAMRATRYTRYLEAMVRLGGDQIAALAEVYELTPQDVEERHLELQADVRAGIGTSVLADVLEKNDLSVAARAAVLRKHLYSTNPAASLKALDLVNDMEGDRADFGSFESYLRLAKGQK